MALLRGSREITLRLLLVAASGLAVLLVGEAVCRAFFPDERLRYAPDDAALYIMRPNQRGVLQLANGRPTPPVHINSLGFRGGEPPPDPARRLLVLGDSFAFGQGVAEDETLVARLDRALGAELAAVNGSQPGYGLFQMRATLDRVGPSLRPEHVVVILWQGDLLRQPPSDEERARVHRASRLFDLVKTSVFVTHVYRRFERLVASHGVYLLDLRVGELEVPAPDDPERVVRAYLQGWEADRPRLAGLVERARSLGAGTSVVLWTREGYAGPGEAGLAGRLEAELAAFARDRDVSVTSLRRVLGAHPRGALLIPGDGHPTAFAHCLVAQHVLGALASHGYAAVEPIRCSPGPEGSASTGNAGSR